MIQRIQTVYLLIALVLVILMMNMPLAEILGKSQEFYSFGIMGTVDVNTDEVVLSSLPMLILFAAISVLILISIFLYKRRVLQMRLVIYSMLLLLGSLGLTYYYFREATIKLDAPNYTFEFPVVFPLVAVILLYLAFRGIRKDELLIRSINRIR